MEQNNLSSLPVPKICLVWEGCLAWVPPDDRKKQRAYERAMSRERWGEAADLFEFNQRMENVIWDRAYKMSFQMDVITYLGSPDFALEVARKIGEEELPIHSVWHTTPQKLGRQLSYMRNIARVYDPFPENALMYGPRGKLIRNENEFGY